MADVFKALGHPARRRILAMLREGPLSSGEIAAAFDMSWPTITGHLTALRDAGLVEAERQGSTIRYRLLISAAEEAVAFLLDLVGAGVEAPAEPSSSNKPPPNKEEKKPA